MNVAAGAATRAPPPALPSAPPISAYAAAFAAPKSHKGNGQLGKSSA